MTAVVSNHGSPPSPPTILDGVTVTASTGTSNVAKKPTPESSTDRTRETRSWSRKIARVGCSAASNNGINSSTSLRISAGASSQSNLFGKVIASGSPANVMPLTCGTRESRYYRARGARASTRQDRANDEVRLRRSAATARQPSAWLAYRSSRSVGKVSEGWRGGRDSSCLAEAEGFSGLTEDVQPGTRPSEARDCGGVDGTRTRGLRRDRPAF